jgi:aspartokinase
MISRKELNRYSLIELLSSKKNMLEANKNKYNQRFQKLTLIIQLLEEMADPLEIIIMIGIIVAENLWSNLEKSKIEIIMIKSKKIKIS